MRYMSNQYRSGAKETLRPSQIEASYLRPTKNFAQNYIVDPAIQTMQAGGQDQMYDTSSPWRRNPQATNDQELIGKKIQRLCEGRI